MAGRIFFARSEPPATAAAPLRLPANPRHAGLRQAGAGDFLFLVSADALDPRLRAVTAELALDGSPASAAGHYELPGRLRLLRPPKPLPLANAHRFLHDGANGPADFPGETDGEKIDAALLYSGCFMDPNSKGSVPKIAQFWRWLNRVDS
jgi:hypothetical protein